MSKARGWPRDWQMPRPPGSAKFANAPPPGLTRGDKCPELAWGGWAQLELTDVLQRGYKASEATSRASCFALL